MPVTPLTLSELPNLLLFEDRRDAVTFVVGSGLTMPISVNPDGTEGLGVSGCRRILESIMAKLRSPKGNPYEACLGELEQLTPLDATTYSKFFEALSRHRIAPQIYLSKIREAVLRAFVQDDEAHAQLAEKAARGDRNACLELELLPDKWHLRKGVEHLGKLIVGNPALFGSTVLTTNFDPLIEIAVRRHSGSPVSIAVSESAEILALQRVLHAHGQWLSGRMLNSISEIRERREQIANYVTGLILESDVVVSGYGGSDDALIQAIEQAALSGNKRIYWCCHSSYDECHTVPLARLRERADRSSLQLFFVENVDSDQLFPLLYEVARTFGLLRHPTDMSLGPRVADSWREAMVKRVSAVEASIDGLGKKMDLMMEACDIRQETASLIDGRGNDAPARSLAARLEAIESVLARIEQKKFTLF